jgi:hypothetical protein
VRPSLTSARARASNPIARQVAIRWGTRHWIVRATPPAGSGWQMRWAGHASSSQPVSRFRCFNSSPELSPNPSFADAAAWASNSKHARAGQLP